VPEVAEEQEEKLPKNGTRKTERRRKWKRMEERRQNVLRRILGIQMAMKKGQLKK
jgi:hypothetical protein